MIFSGSQAGLWVSDSSLRRGESQDGVYKPQVIKRKPCRGGNSRPSADQRNALPLGHTSPQTEKQGSSDCFNVPSTAQLVYFRTTSND